MKKRFRKIYIEITNICNLKCEFCIDTKRKKEYMPVGNFESIVNQVKEYTDLLALHVKGEPLIHPELDSILLLCDKNDIMVNITTNGTILLDKIEMILQHKSVRQINVSVHSIIENSFDLDESNKYIENIFKAVRIINEKTNIYISYRFWLENKYNILLFNELQNEYGTKDLIQKLNRNNSIKLQDRIYLNKDISFIWPSMEDEIVSEKGTCLGLKNQIAILVNGTVVPCCIDHDANINLGNVLEMPLKDILDNEKSKKILKGFEENCLVEELCKRCTFRKRFVCS